MIHTFQSALRGPMVCESTATGCTYYQFQTVTGCRFAEAILISYERLNERINERNRAAREALFDELHPCLIGVRGNNGIPGDYDRGARCPSPTSFTTAEGRSFTAAVSESYDALNARRAAQHESQLVRLSVEEYRTLRVGEFILRGDEVRERGRWIPVDISVGFEVPAVCVGELRRRLTD